MAKTLVAIIGAGTIGADVALDLALHDYDVILKDISAEILKTAQNKIRSSYRFTKMINKSVFLPPIDYVFDSINMTLDYSDFEKADLLIENIQEDYEAKKNVYLELSKVFNENAIYGVNTSCISITKIAALLPKPDNVIGTHFMNPVPLSKMVEVVRGYHTSETTVEKTKIFVKSIKKQPVVVNDSPGFVTNRVMMLTINECIWLVHDQVAEPKAIDTIFKLGFSHKMGPLATADLIGLDTILNSLTVLYEGYNDPKYRPCPLLKKMVDAGILGKKSGKGFFNYRSSPEELI
jgi:3-hydroxybutyryl-CoA dehydrogenase